MDTPYKVKLEAFNGPLDLLLFLVTKEEVDLYDIPLARIVDQYMEYLDAMRAQKMEVTGDFIVMASTLMLIKSRMLLPTEEIDLEEEIDPRDELIQQLLDYKKYKTLSRELDGRRIDRALKTGRPKTVDQAAEEEVPLEEVSLWDLVKAFSKVLEDTGRTWGSTIIHSEKPISTYISNILETLRTKSKVSFVQLFADSRSREEVLGHFIGILELTRLSVIKITQNAPGGEIQIGLIVSREKLEAFRARDPEAVLLDQAPEEAEPLWRESMAPADEKEALEPFAAPFPRMKPSRKAMYFSKRAFEKKIEAARTKAEAARDAVRASEQIL